MSDILKYEIHTVDGKTVTTEANHIEYRDGLIVFLVLGESEDPLTDKVTAAIGTPHFISCAVVPDLEATTSRPFTHDCNGERVRAK